MEERSPKPWTKENARDKITKFCLYQERCTREVYEKLSSHRIFDPLRQDIIDELLEEGYIDEMRYSTAVVKGKYNRLKWGTVKIRTYLSNKNIPKSIIDEVFSKEIEEEASIDKIVNLISRKLKNSESEPDFQTKNKINIFLRGKGYELDVIKRGWEVWKENS